jgi:PhnB protein
MFSALSTGAKAVSMPPTETFWAERFTMFTDRYGTPWMINFFGRKNVDAGAQNAS